MNPLFWYAYRLWARVRRGRAPPAELPDPVWYFAFGSNMNDRLFRERRHMTPLETRVARLDGFRLRFVVAGKHRRGPWGFIVNFAQRFDQIAAGGRKPGLSAPSDIVARPGESVWGVAYLLSMREFARLDASEGRQYVHHWVDVVDMEGRPVRAITFRVPYAVSEGRPSEGYIGLIRTAARERGLPEDYIALLDRVEARPT